MALPIFPVKLVHVNNTVELFRTLSTFTTKESIKTVETYFLFLRSTAGFLGSFLGIEDPVGMAYCIGERDEAVAGGGTGPGPAVAAAAVDGNGTGGAEVGGALAGSGSGLGKICFNLLFR